MCTHKAQMDLRNEENIDAFSMNDEQGRHSPTSFKVNNEDNGISLFNL